LIAFGSPIYRILCLFALVVSFAACDSGNGSGGGSSSSDAENMRRAEEFKRQAAELNASIEAQNRAQKEAYDAATKAQLAEIAKLNPADVDPAETAKRPTPVPPGVDPARAQARLKPVTEALAKKDYLELSASIHHVQKSYPYISAVERSYLTQELRRLALETCDLLKDLPETSKLPETHLLSLVGLEPRMGLRYFINTLASVNVLVAAHAQKLRVRTQELSRNLGAYERLSHDLMTSLFALDHLAVGDLAPAVQRMAQLKPLLQKLEAAAKDLRDGKANLEQTLVKLASETIPAAL